MKTRDQRRDVAEKQLPELQRMLTSAREELRDLRFRIAANQHKDVRELRAVRHRIARILSRLNAPTPKRQEKKA